MEHKKIMNSKTKNSTGFTLVECLIAVMLVAIAISALLSSSRGLTEANGAGVNLSTAEFLLEEIRELTTTLAAIDPQTGTGTFGAETGEVLADFDDVDDFDGASFSPPINAARQTLTDFSAFTQQITVENVSPINLETVVADHSSPFVRITVQISLGSKSIISASWLRSQ